MIHLFVLAGGALACVGSILLARAGRFQTQSRSKDWSELVAELQAINYHDLETVATNYLQPQKNQIALETNQMWHMLGGVEHFSSLRSNTQIMIALAVHVQQWNFEEAAIVAETMRRDAVRLTKALNKVETALLFTRSKMMVPFYLHEAAAAYFLMRQRLLTLCERSHAGLYFQLEAALS